MYFRIKRRLLIGRTIHVCVTSPSVQIQETCLESTQFSIYFKSQGIPWRSSGLGLCAFTAKGVGLVPGRGAKVPQAAGYGKKKKKVKSTFSC